MCTCVHISVTKSCIVGYLDNGLWGLWDRSIAISYHWSSQNRCVMLQLWNVINEQFKITKCCYIIPVKASVWRICLFLSCWYQDMHMCSASMAVCEGNPLVSNAELWLTGSYNQYHSCWCPADAGHRASAASIILDIPEHSGPSTRKGETSMYTLMYSSS